MVCSQKGKEKIGCDGMCYGCCHDFPKGHPDRREPCSIFETCPYNPKIHEEFLVSILAVLLFILFIVVLM